MEPAFEAMLKSIPGGNQVIEQFKLVFPTVSATVSVSNVSAYNSVAGNSNVLTVSTPGVPRRVLLVTAATKATCNATIPMSLKKRDYKTYMLSLCVEATRDLRHLKEEILEQLGKDVVSFDLQCWIP